MREPAKRNRMLDRRGELRIPELVIGIGIGLLAGLLWAPRAGEQTRQDVRRRADLGLDYLNQQAERLRAGAEKVVAMTKEWIARHGEATPPVTETELQQAYEDKSEKV